MNRPKFEIYFSQAKDYRWRLKSTNGEIAAVSEGYTTKYSAKRSAERMKELAWNAEIIEI